MMFTNATSTLHRDLLKMKSVLLLTVYLALSSFLSSKEVSLPVDGNKLVGTLTPSEKNKTQVVFILSGSGPTDRDGNTVGAPGKNNSLKYLAEALNERGLATLRVDKRGVGASAQAAPQEKDLRFSAYVEDAGRWIKFLEEQGYSEIILLGHSEGALVATLAASKDSVKALICLAGAGQPADVALLEQLRPKLPSFLFKETEEILATLKKGETVEDYPPALESLFSPSVQPYLISWFQIDPVEAISKVTVPVLIMQGTTDLQVSEKDAERLHAGAKGSQLIKIKGMNHILKEVAGDLPAQMPSYFDPELELQKDLADEIVTFIESAS